MMQGIIDLHHDIFFFLILILVFVSRILVRALWDFQKDKNPIPQRIIHGTTIEIFRTIFPSIIPMFIAITSFALLYSMDEVVVNLSITIKGIGHQWYQSVSLYEGDLSATKCLKNMVCEASGLLERTTSCSCSSFFALGMEVLWWVTAGTSNLTEGDQRFYSSTEEPFAAKGKGCLEWWEVTENYLFMQ
uniref:Cytochrome c oxidase subunit 2, mitochondrial n=1 Tax=Tanacetum cinerariifolium TaxID=118510 RepID=A0A6L2JFA6_TANCI|nr:cytochrome c oxidase subunit 2, mitochondrial [Tanacetum cinerariifolium]